METRPTRASAQRALGEIEQAQQDAAGRLRTPWWYWHVFASALVLMMATAWLTQAFSPWLFPVILLATFGAESWLRRHVPAGTFGWNRRAKWIGLLCALGAVALFAAALFGSRALDHWWPFAVAVPAIYLLTVSLGRLSERGIDTPSFVPSSPSGERVL